jgi:dephospho-CoA kinase
MLRVGLTGELGSGKSTVAKMLAARGAIVFSSDEMARAMMQPGEPVYAQIVAHFGKGILAADKSIDRRRLAKLAFDPAHPCVEELNAIVHPAVLGAQAEQIAGIARTQPDATVVVESALIMSTKHSGENPWRDRFDRIVVVTAPQEQKIARFVQRMAAERSLSAEERAALVADARRRLAQQKIAPKQSADCIVIRNEGNVSELEAQVEKLWRDLRAARLVLPGY